MSEQIKVGGRYRYTAPHSDRYLDSIVVEIREDGLPVVVEGCHWDDGQRHRTDVWDGLPFLECHTFREMAFDPAEKPPEHPDSAQLLEARSHEFAVLAGQDRELIKVLLRRLLRELEGGA